MNSNEDAQKQTTFADAIEAAAIVAGIAGGAFGAYKLGKALPKAGKTVKEGINNIGKKAFDSRYNLEKAAKKEYDKARKVRTKQYNNSDWVKENTLATVDDLNKVNDFIDKTAKEDAIKNMLNKNKYKNLRERKNIRLYKNVKDINFNIGDKNIEFNPNEKISNAINKTMNKAYDIGDSIEKKINPYYNDKTVYQQLKDILTPKSINGGSSSEASNNINFNGPLLPSDNASSLLPNNINFNGPLPPSDNAPSLLPNNPTSPLLPSQGTANIVNLFDTAKINNIK